MSSNIPFLIKSIGSHNVFRPSLLFSFLSTCKQQQNLRGRITGKNMSHCYFSSTVEASDLEDDKLHDDVKAAEKHTALHSALSELAGDFDGESMLFLQRFFRTRVKPVVSTGSLKLDLALGIGGLPKGRIVEVYGQEGSGKTTLALNVIKEAQKLGGYCAYLDVENALDPLLLETVGVNTKSLLISQPNSAENLLSIVDTLTQSGAVDVIVIDSVAALIPQREITGAISDNIIETQSRIMTRALRKIHYSLCRSDTLIIFINQVRSNLRSRQEGLRVNEVTCGGNALPFYSAVRMRIARKGLLKTQEKVTGLGICVEVVKNKLAPAMKKAELEIEFGRGISRASEVLQLGCEHGVVLKEGNSYFIDGEVVNGKMQAETYLIQNTLICDKLVKTLRRHLFRIEQDSES
ncbi:DNA repair protein recA homolog 2, mitochondrial [Lactuca sativa]|uniref:DNA repair protein recA homolog 2, mitochondrial n=1 Tax=Lactuca sativa TaxID=4236 RepID=UPI000CA6AFF6|nr:DNA repair protein recA homolog 2, mitochondrial [Lactuca sativa]